MKIVSCRQLTHERMLNSFGAKKNSLSGGSKSKSPDWARSTGYTYFSSSFLFIQILFGLMFNACNEQDNHQFIKETIYFLGQVLS